MKTTLENNTRREPEAVTIAEKTLEHINWTGMSLFELIDAGRVYPEPKEILQWAKSACGPAMDLQHLQTMKEAARIICARFNPSLS
jgi:hypothetical protein